VRGARLRQKWLVLTPLLALSLAFTLLPVAWMVFTSFKTAHAVFGAPGRLLPPVWTLAAYRAVLSDSHFIVYFANSLFVNLSASIATVGLATLAGYSFSRLRIRGRQVMMLSILATQMFPSAVILIALYVIFRRLDLLDTYGSLILSYVTLGLPFSVWMMRGFAEAVPVDVEEAAMIDGCSRLQALLRVVVPMMLPGMIAVALFSFLVGWNDLIWALTLTTSPSMRLIPPGFVATYVGQFQTYWNQLMAGSVLVSLPTVIIFILLQKYLVQGISSGAVKG